MEFFLNENFIIFSQLLIAIVFGGVLGVERSLAGKTAGVRTYALVSMGSTLFVLISKIVSSEYVNMINFDPLRMASQVIVGVGFLGAGLIIFKDSRVSGLTTAAGLWVSAGIGVAVGFKLYFLAFFATILTLFVFVVLWFIEKRFKGNNSGIE